MKQPLSSLILMLTDRCNLSCVYCYLGSRKTGPDSGRDMSFELMDRALALWSGVRPGRCRVRLTGGEPFLVPDRVAYLADRMRRISPTVPISVQTNATRLDDTAIDLVKAYGLDLDISLDGDPTIQERCRGGAGQIFRTLGLLEEREVPFNITCVLSSLNAAQLQRLGLSLAGFSMARSIGLDPLVMKGDAPQSGIQPADPAQIISGMKKLRLVLKMVNSGRNQPLVIREQEKLTAWARSGCRSQDFCRSVIGRSLAVTPDGSLYPCIRTVYDSRFFMGSLDGPPGEP